MILFFAQLMKKFRIRKRKRRRLSINSQGDFVLRPLQVDGAQRIEIIRLARRIDLNRLLDKALRLEKVFPILQIERSQIIEDGGVAGIEAERRSIGLFCGDIILLAVVSVPQEALDHRGRRSFVDRCLIFRNRQVPLSSGFIGKPKLKMLFAGERIVENNYFRDDPTTDKPEEEKRQKQTERPHRR